MGSIAASALIISISFFVSFTLVYSATMDTQYKLQRAIEIRERLNKAYYDSSIQIIEALRWGENISILILNDGKIPLNPNYLSLIVNGKPVEILETKVGSRSTNVWLPGEVANITSEFRGNIERVLIVTEYGSTAYYSR